MSLVLGLGVPNIRDQYLELGSGKPKTRYRLKLVLQILASGVMTCWMMLHHQLKQTLWIDFIPIISSCLCCVGLKLKFFHDYTAKKGKSVQINIA